MTNTERYRAAAAAARRRGGLHHAAGDRRVGQTIKARRQLTTRRVGASAWLTGRNFGWR